MTGRPEDGGRGGEPLVRLVSCFGRRPCDGGGWLSLRGRGKGVGDGRKMDTATGGRGEVFRRLVDGISDRCMGDHVYSTSFGGDPGDGEGWLSLLGRVKGVGDG